jgi:hypothetical protein
MNPDPSENAPLLTKIGPGLVLLVTLIPGFFFRLNHLHDWGDDFAQYLLQALLLAGKLDSFPATDFTDYAPSVKGLLFSVMLLPTVWIPQSDILTGKIIVAFTWLAWSAAVFYWAKKSWGVVAALCIALLLAYHPQILQLKDQILPDLMFMTCLIVIVYLSSSSNYPDWEKILLFTAVSIALKSAGWVLIPSLAAWYIFNPSHSPVRVGLKRKFLLNFALWISVVMLSERYLMPQSGGIWWYTDTTFRLFDLQVISGNFAAYREAWRILFEMELPQWLNRINLVIISLSAFAGWLITMVKKPLLSGWILLSYTVTLLVYPYSADPVRLMLPLLPLVLFYSVEFVASVPEYLRINFPVKWFRLAVLLFLLMSQVLSIKYLFNTTPRYGLSEPESLQLIGFIKNHVSDQEIIACQKPFAISYFTGKTTTSDRDTGRSNATLILLNKPAIDLDQANTNALVFSNSQFQIVRR